MMVKLAGAVTLVLSMTHGARVVRKAGTGARAQCGSKGARRSSEVNISIINGAPASECEWIWQVSLEDSGGHFCGGMLVAPDWVLTAAHCSGRRNAKNIRAGHYEVEDGGQVVRVDKFIPHPSYDSSTDEYDIALIRLKSPMQMNSCTGLVCLPDRDVSPGTSCWITGWGSTIQEDPEERSLTRGADKLQEAQVDILSNKECDKTGNEGWIYDDMICAQGENSKGFTDACQGDSGGPLVCNVGGKWSVYGATSWGSGCGSEDYPGVYSRVHYSLSWIESTMSGGGSSPERRRGSSPTPDRRRRSRRRDDERRRRRRRV